MQQAMNNAKKEADNAWNSGKAQLDRGVSEVKGETKHAISEAKSTLAGMDFGDIKSVASDITDKVRSVSGDAFRDSVSFVKRYPVASALGLAAVGYLVGAFSARARK